MDPRKGSSRLQPSRLVVCPGLQQHEPARTFDAAPRVLESCVHGECAEPQFRAAVEQTPLHETCLQPIKSELRHAQAVTSGSSLALVEAKPDPGFVVDAPGLHF